MDTPPPPQININNLDALFEPDSIDFGPTASVATTTTMNTAMTTSKSTNGSNLPNAVQARYGSMPSSSSASSTSSSSSSSAAAAAAIRSRSNEQLNLLSTLLDNDANSFLMANKQPSNSLHNNLHVNTKSYPNYVPAQFESFQTNDFTIQMSPVPANHAAYVHLSSRGAFSPSHNGLSPSGASKSFGQAKKNDIGLVGDIARSRFFLYFLCI